MKGTHYLGSPLAQPQYKVYSTTGFPFNLGGGFYNQPTYVPIIPLVSTNRLGVLHL